MSHADVFFAQVWFPAVIVCGIFALLELVAARVSVSAWMWALESSGKPTFLFGFTYWWPMSLICISMYAAGAVCVILNALGFVIQKATRFR